MGGHFLNSLKRYASILALIVSASFAFCCEDNGVVKTRFEPLIHYDYPTASRYAQGMDILEGRIFQAFSDGTIDIYDIETRWKIQTIGPLLNERGEVLHMNDISFYERDGENKSALLIPGNGINDSITLYNISIDSIGFFKMNQDIRFPSPNIDKIEYRSSTPLFGNDNSLIQVAYKRTSEDGFGDSIIEGYEFKELSSNVCYEKKWTTEHDIMWAMQGAAFSNGNCYLAVGVSRGDAKIYKIDNTTGFVTCFIDFRDGQDRIKGEEMQGIAFYQGDLYFSTTYGFYKVLKSNYVNDNI